MPRRSDITIWIKNQSKEKVLLETIKAYEACYPRKFEFIKQGLRRLREVTVEAHRDLKGREVDVNIRVPSELFLFLQSIIPDFGKDSDDIALLARTWEDFAVARKRDKRFKKTLLWSSSFLKAPDHKEPAAADDGVQPQHTSQPLEGDPSLRGDDHEELRGAVEGDAGVDQPKLLEGW